MKGGPPAPQLASEISPALPFFSGAENRYLEGWETFASLASVPAPGAGLQAGHRLRNPTGSNVVAVFIKIQVGGPLADSPVLTHGRTVNDLPTGGSLTTTNFDPRGRPQPTLIFSQGSIAGQLLTNAQQAFFTANTQVDFLVTDIQELPLLPGDAMMVQSSVLNQALTSCMWWRERSLEESELK
jgi:hypothetical protein